MNIVIQSSQQILASYLGSGGAFDGFNPLYQVRGPRSIQLTLNLRFEDSFFVREFPCVVEHPARSRMLLRP